MSAPSRSTILVALIGVLTIAPVGLGLAKTKAPSACRTTGGDYVCKQHGAAQVTPPAAGQRELKTNLASSIPAGTLFVVDRKSSAMLGLRPEATCSIEKQREPTRLRTRPNADYIFTLDAGGLRCVFSQGPNSGRTIPLFCKGAAADCRALVLASGAYLGAELGTEPRRTRSSQCTTADDGSVSCSQSLSTMCTSENGATSCSSCTTDNGVTNCTKAQTTSVSQTVILDLCRGSVTISLPQADGSVTTRKYSAMAGERAQITLVDTSSFTQLPPGQPSTGSASSGSVAESEIVTSDLGVCALRTF